MGGLCWYNSLCSKTGAFVVNNFFFLGMSWVIQANLKKMYLCCKNNVFIMCACLLMCVWLVKVLWNGEKSHVLCKKEFISTKAGEFLKECIFLLSQKQCTCWKEHFLVSYIFQWLLIILANFHQNYKFLTPFPVILVSSLGLALGDPLCMKCLGLRLLGLWSGDLRQPNCVECLQCQRCLGCCFWVPGWVSWRRLSRVCKGWEMSGSLLQGWELSGAFGVCNRVRSCWLCTNIPQILSRSTTASICVLIHVE